MTDRGTIRITEARLLSHYLLLFVHTIGVHVQINDLNQQKFSLAPMKIGYTYANENIHSRFSQVKWKSLNPYLTWRDLTKLLLVEFIYLNASSYYANNNKYLVGTIAELLLINYLFPDKSRQTRFHRNFSPGINYTK